jgi:hypothetical protein
VQVVSWHREYVVTISLALLSGCFPVTGAFADANLPGRDCHASFSCPVGTGPKCWFTIAMSSGTKTFTVAAGHSQTMYGLTRGDVVCDSNDGPPATGPAGHCRDINMICARN